MSNDLTPQFNFQSPSLWANDALPNQQKAKIITKPINLQNFVFDLSQKRTTPKQLDIPIMKGTVCKYQCSPNWNLIVIIILNKIKSNSISMNFIIVEPMK